MLLRAPKWVLTFGLFALFFISLSANFLFSDGYVHFVSQNFKSLAALFENGQSTIFFLLPFRIFEFLCGAAIVFFPNKRPSNTFLENQLTIVGLALIVASVLLFDSNTLFPSYNALVPCIGTALVVRFGRNCTIGKIVGNKVFIWIGLISYSIYLVHWPIIVFYKYLTLNHQLPVFAQLALGSSSILLGWISYKHIEKPFRKQPPNTMLRGGAAFSSVFALTILLAITINSQDGWKWRSTYAQNWPTNIKNTNFRTESYGGNGFNRFAPINPTEKIDFLLAGDSHALHYAAGFEKLSQQNGINTFISAGTSCLHLPNFTRKSLSQNYDIACPKSFEKLIKVVDENETIKAVFLAQRWNIQLPASAILDRNGNVMNGSPSLKDVELAILSLKKQLGDVTLVLIGQLPETGDVDIHEYINRPFWSKSFSDVSAQVNSSDLTEQTTGNNKFLMSISSQNDGILFLDPTDNLCNSNNCRNFDAVGNLLYSDDHHLSKAGSEFVIESFTEDIKSLVRPANVSHLNKMVIGVY